MRLINYKQKPEMWSSFDRLSSLRDLLDSAFELAGTGSVPGLAGRGWSPALEVIEDEECITVRLEVAGMKKEDFDLSLQDDNLMISGERRQENAVGQGESFRSERFFGKFSRTVQLSSPVQSGAVEATYENGVLTVTLPKSEEAKPKRIEVQLR